MKFTYRGYRELLSLLRAGGYAFRGYQNYKDAPRCVILRHDIDNSFSQAVRLAELEAEEGVRSTYFVLLRTDFYNPASRSGEAALRRIRSLGHEIGLHFDEASYVPALTPEELPGRAAEEAGLLSALLGAPVASVSMHRPSKTTLEADYQIPGLVNSYGRTFFREFKYLSDARRRWREPVEEIIRSGVYDRLHILVHPFWYHEEEEDIARTVDGFIRAAPEERRRQLAENITDLNGILGREHPCG